MINCSYTKNKDTIKQVITHPDLYELSGFTEDPLKYTPNLQDLWIAIKEDKQLIGIAQLREFNKITLDAHICILPEYQNKDYSINAAQEAIQYLKLTTSYRKLLVTTPITCSHAIRYVTKLGFTTAGMIQNGICYKNNIQDLLIFQYDIGV